MTDKELRDLAVKELQGTWYGYRVRPHSPRWNRAMDYLAQIGTQPEPEPEPEPEPPAPKLAPQTYNKGSAGQDARYCIAGLPQDSSGAYVDAGGYRYDSNGLSLGGRSGQLIPELKPADMMDDKGACDSYEWQGRVFPPWPSKSYEP